MHHFRREAKIIMSFYKLPSNSRKLLRELVESDNPTQTLSQKYQNASGKDKSVLRGIIKELSNTGYINVQWADNIPYIVSINNCGLTYEELLTEYENKHQTSHSSSITIGNNNNISNATIGNMDENPKSEKSFTERHPFSSGIIIAIVAAVAAGFILMFHFWKNIVTFIEGFFVNGR